MNPTFIIRRSLPTHRDLRPAPATNGAVSSEAEAGRALPHDNREARPAYFLDSDQDNPFHRRLSFALAVAAAWLVFHFIVACMFIGLAAVRIKGWRSTLVSRLSTAWFHLTKTVICCWCKKVLRRPRLPFIRATAHNTTGSCCPACLEKYILPQVAAPHAPTTFTQ